ncbi:MAG: hypothetical protein Q8S31_07755 [Alphaproteobacteria bacterium]|nr:hypothetical protein [Alphaproteobacteria bacterium]
MIKLRANHAIGVLLVFGKPFKDLYPKPVYEDKSTMIVENHF